MTETEKLVEALKEIGWQDIRLVVGEGKLKPADVMTAVNIILKQRRSCLTAWNTRPSVYRDAVIACIRDASDRAFEAGRTGDIHFRFADIIARADALLASQEG
jgi:hypothetical protein